MSFIVKVKAGNSLNTQMSLNNKHCDGFFFLIFSHNTFIINFLDYDLSKMRDFINHQADAYVEKGILDKEEANAIKRIYSSL